MLHEADSHWRHTYIINQHTVYPKKYAHGFVVLCFVVVMQSFIMNSHEVFIHIHQSCFAGTGAIVRLPQCQWSGPDGYGKISQCITITKHSKAKTVCIFLGIYCTQLQPGACVLHDKMNQFFWDSYIINGYILYWPAVVKAYATSYEHHFGSHFTPLHRRENKIIDFHYRPSQNIWVGTR